jgi:hypothetical protein
MPQNYLRGGCSFHGEKFEFSLMKRELYTLSHYLGRCLLFKYHW